MAQPLTTAPLKAGGGRSSLPQGPGPCSGPQTCLEPECPVPLHSVCLLEAGAHETSATLLVKCPGVGSTTALSLVWTVFAGCPDPRGHLAGKQKGGSRQVLALSKKAAASPQEDPAGLGATLAPLGDDGTTLSASIL